jgi:hypothetical protein
MEQGETGRMEEWNIGKVGGQKNEIMECGENGIRD